MFSLSVGVPASSHRHRPALEAVLPSRLSQEAPSSVWLCCSGHKTIFVLSDSSPRENITNQEMDEDTTFQKSLITDKDRELESLRSEVGLGRPQSASIGPVGDDP